MTMAQSKVNWYLYVFGLSIGVAGAWLGLEQLRDQLGFAALGWLLCLLGVYLIRRSYRSSQSNKTTAASPQRTVHKRYGFRSNPACWRILRMTMVASFALGAIAFGALYFLATHDTRFGESYAVGLIGSYLFIALFGIGGVCVGLEVMRLLYRRLSK